MFIDETQNIVFIEGVDSSTAFIKGLQPYTWYDYYILAYTEGGEGPVSDNCKHALRNRTAEARKK